MISYLPAALFSLTLYSKTLPRSGIQPKTGTLLVSSSSIFRLKITGSIFFSRSWFNFNIAPWFLASLTLVNCSPSKIPAICFSVSSVASGINSLTSDLKCARYRAFILTNSIASLISTWLNSFSAFSLRYALKNPVVVQFCLVSSDHSLCLTLSWFIRLANSAWLARIWSERLFLSSSFWTAAIFLFNSSNSISFALTKISAPVNSCHKSATFSAFSSKRLIISKVICVFEASISWAGQIRSPRFIVTTPNGLVFLSTLNPVPKLPSTVLFFVLSNLVIVSW